MAWCISFIAMQAMNYPSGFGFPAPKGNPSNNMIIAHL